MTDEDWDKCMSPAYYPDVKKLKAIKSPLTADWGALISDADVNRLKRGSKS